MASNVWGSVIGGLLGAAGNVYSANVAAAGAEEANEANREMLDQTLSWQERMSKNKHQYEVTDLRLAGLNPVLSANSAGSVPGASYAPAQNTKAISSDLLQKGSTSAMDVGVKTAMIAKANEEVKQEKIRTNVAEETKNAAIAQIKAEATARAVSSARSLTQMEFNQSWLGKKTIQWREAIRNIFGQ